MSRWLRTTLVASCAILLYPHGVARAQTAENVLLVVNTMSAASKEIGEHYAKVRAIPASQVVRLEVTDADMLSRQEYQQGIERPIAEWISAHDAHDRILYIVLTKGVPLRIDGTAGPFGSTASVDSELTLLYRRMTGAPVAPQGHIANPYFASGDVSTAARFTHREHDIFLVTRLDGFTVSDVIALIDRGSAPSPEGMIVLDQRADLSTRPGDGWLKAAADALREKGFGDRTILEDTTRPFAGPAPVLGYYTWGSNDGALRPGKPAGLVFSAGALGATFLSADARTFREPPADWTPGDGQRGRLFAGSAEALTGQLVRDGITGALGNVTEPLTEAAVRPAALFLAYLSGFNLAESFYLATPFLSWQSVVVGDPLCAPFARTRASTDDVHGSLDSTTELPVFFSERRLRVLSAGGLQPEVLQQFMRAEARLAHDDKVAAREALEAATAKEPRFSVAQMMLASLYEVEGKYDLAMERYKTILSYTPNEPLALNNLAYALAVRRNDPQQALPLARKAHTLLRNAASADTLGWILYLTGDTGAAAPLFAEIMATRPTSPDILIHAATVFAAAGRPDTATEVLNRASAIDPTIETRDAVKDLRKSLKAGKPKSGA